MNTINKQSEPKKNIAIDKQPVVIKSADKTIHPFSYWLKKNSYYHQQLLSFYQFLIAPGSYVMHVDGKNGYVVSSLLPSYGVVVDDDRNAREEGKVHDNQVAFFSSLNEVPRSQVFDYIILSCSTMQTYDIQELFEQLQLWCSQDTRIIVDTYATSWEPLLKLTQKLGLRRPTTFHNWISSKDLENFLYLADFEIVTQGRHTIIPTFTPFISFLFNSILALIPGMNRLCLHQWFIARPMPKTYYGKDYLVSVIIPCRNERGNIEQAIIRTPMMGKHTEFIFVEGHSHDDTRSEIERVIAAYPDRDIRYLVQPGKGKGDAVRAGFDVARGDVFMILDADLTMPPEELPRFFDALMRGKGDLINGSRLVYNMETKAMRFLNFLVNHCFSMLFTWLLGQRIKDTLCGTKVLFKTTYTKIVKNRSYFGELDPYGDFDLLFGAAKLNLKICDMPVHYKNRTYGTSQISRFQGGFLLLMMSITAFKKFKIR